MIIIRIASSLTLLLLGFWITEINLSPLLEYRDHVSLPGLVNIWAGIACLFWGGYGVLYYLLHNKLKPKKDQIFFNFNKMTIMIGLMLSPILSLFVHQEISLMVESYIECKDLRELSSRYSSRTYAISPEVCESLKRS